MQLTPIVALDVEEESQAEKLLADLQVEPRPIIKIGMEMYYGFGPRIIELVQQQGFQVFLDLKLHDIPNTVERAMHMIGGLGVAITTIHAAGGSEMLQAGLRGLQAGAKQSGHPTPKLLAITQLTSIDEQILHEEQHINLSLPESVQQYALLAEKNGLDGVICSGQEVQLIRAVCGDWFLCVTPGIRPADYGGDDQKRVVTPQEAHRLGANGIVVGRPITQAADPRQAYEAIATAFMEVN